MWTYNSSEGMKVLILGLIGILFVVCYDSILLLCFGCWYLCHVVVVCYDSAVYVLVDIFVLHVS